MTRIITAILISSTLFATGCVDMADETVPVDPTQPEPQIGPVLVAGSYTVVTTFDLTLDVVLPERAYNTISVLQDFRDEPAATMFQLLDDAGVPVVGDLLAALPDSLESRLMGWIDSYLQQAVFDEVPVMELIDEILAVAHTSLTRFDMVSDLDIADADASGQTTLTHRLHALAFPLSGQTYSVEIPDLGPLTSAASDAWIDRANTSADGHLIIGEHEFGLPYGEYAYQAVEAAVTARYGAGIRDTLGAAVNCPALAADVANKCVFGLCVGHEQDLNELCEAGLDMVVDELHARFEAHAFEAIHLAAGEAEMLDAAGEARDGAIDHLSGGLWQSSINAGMGLREIGATFEGTRQ